MKIIAVCKNKGFASLTHTCILTHNSCAHFFFCSEVGKIFSPPSTKCLLLFLPSQYLQCHLLFLLLPFYAFFYQWSLPVTLVSFSDIPHRCCYFQQRDSSYLDSVLDFKFHLMFNLSVRFRYTFRNVPCRLESDSGENGMRIFFLSTEGIHGAACQWTWQWTRDEFVGTFLLIVYICW